MKVFLRGRGDFDEWRHAARRALQAGLTPREVEWRIEGGDDLFAGGDAAPVAVSTGAIVVPKAFVELAEALICHSDPARFDLAYRLLWRLQTERHLLEATTDPDVNRAHRMTKSIRRDYHKMTAFVRFKEVPSATSRRAFVAWFEPDHFIVARVAPFFQRRFTDMDWVIATPKGAASWDGHHLSSTDEPAAKPDLSDEADELWRTYFASIFNPARLKVKMMQTEMPKKYWKNLPEAELIPELIGSAEQRVRDMAQRMADDTVPEFHRRLKSRTAQD